jgi:hypothetical protein
MAFREFGFGKTRTLVRRENAITFRPRDSGGGGPLELAKRANRGGGSAGLVALSSLQKDDNIEVASLRCGQESSKLKVGVF